MSLSSTTLSVIQKAGAAAFAADVQLKNAVKDYAERVNAAMLNNPDGLGNDVLFSNWKIVSRLSQTLSTIEEEIRKLFLVASDLGNAPKAAPASAPAKAKKIAKKVSVAKAKATTVKTKVAPAVVEAAVKPKAAAKAKAVAKVVTPKAKTAKVKVAKVKAVKAKVVKAKSAPKAPRAATLGANPTKVLRHLETLLNANDFTEISQTAVSKETGIPLGSMTAATKKLLETGHLVAGPSGSFKLAAAPAAPAAAE